MTSIPQSGLIWFATVPFHVGLVQAKSADGELLTPAFMWIRQGRGVKVRFEEPQDGVLEISEG